MQEYDALLEVYPEDVPECSAEEIAETRKEVSGWLARYKKQAEEYLNDPDKLEELLQKVEKKLASIPYLGSILSYIPLFISMLRSYIKKEYRDIPAGSVAAIIVALLYVVTPLDLIADVLGPVGYLDDAAVVLITAKFVAKDLEDYRAWRKANGKEFEISVENIDTEKENRLLSSLRLLLHKKDKEK